MNQTQQFTALIEREDNGYVSLCPELDIASQGDTVEEAKHNLVEAIELFFEVADPTEISTRLKSTETTITVPVLNHKQLKAGTLSSIIRQSQLSRSHFEA